MILFRKSFTILVLLLITHVYADDAVDPDDDILVHDEMETTSTPFHLVIQAVDQNAINEIMKEDLSMYSLGSQNRRRRFEVNVGVKTSNMVMESFPSNNAVFEHIDIDLQGVVSFTIDKTDGVENHWTGKSVDPQDFSELYMMYDPQTNHFLSTVNSANGQLLTVNTRADGTTWATVLLPEVSRSACSSQ